MSGLNSTDGCPSLLPFSLLHMFGSCVFISMPAVLSNYISVSLLPHSSKILTKHSMKEQQYGFRLNGTAVEGVEETVIEHKEYAMGIFWDLRKDLTLLTMT